MIWDNQNLPNLISDWIRNGVIAEDASQLQEGIDHLSPWTTFSWNLIYWDNVATSITSCSSTNAPKLLSDRPVHLFSAVSWRCTKDIETLPADLWVELLCSLSQKPCYHLHWLVILILPFPDQMVLRCAAKSLTESASCVMYLPDWISCKTAPTHQLCLLPMLFHPGWCRQRTLLSRWPAFTQSRQSPRILAIDVETARILSRCKPSLTIKRGRCVQENTVSRGVVESSRVIRWRSDRECCKWEETLNFRPRSLVS